MDPTTPSCWRAARQAARGRIASAAVGLACVLGASAAPLSTVAQVRYHSDCQVIDEMELERFGSDGEPAELSHFTCRISGGPLDGFAVNGTNIWELSGGRGTLIGSFAVGQTANSTVAYEVQDVVRKQRAVQGRVIGRERLRPRVLPGRHGLGSLIGRQDLQRDGATNRPW